MEGRVDRLLNAIRDLGKRGRAPAALTVFLIFSILSLSIFTGIISGRAAVHGQEAELLYKQMRHLEGVLGQLQFEVRSLKTPSEIKIRLKNMQTNSKTQSSKKNRPQTVSRP